MKAGKYYIGDPIYFFEFSEEKLEEFFENADPGSEGIFEGQMFWCHPVDYTECLFDYKGRHFPVETGSIFCISIPSETERVEGGHLEVFEQDFSCSESNGEFHFGKLTLSPLDDLDDNAEEFEEMGDYEGEEEEERDLP